MYSVLQERCIHTLCYVFNCGCLLPTNLTPGCYYITCTPQMTSLNPHVLLHTAYITYYVNHRYYNKSWGWYYAFILFVM